MSEEQKEQTEMLNDVSNLENASSTHKVDPTYINKENAGILYKKIIRSLNNYSKGEILLKDDIINLVRHEYETL